MEEPEHHCCHGDGAGGLTFNSTHASITSATTTEGNLVIVPFSANSSLIYIIISPTYIGLNRMPRFSDTLTTIQQNLIRDWIDEGALDN